ncbi:MAG: hypothetical protein ACFB20_08950 [Opitutales bacterium]
MPFRTGLIILAPTGMLLALTAQEYLGAPFAFLGSLLLALTAAITACLAVAFAMLTLGNTP